MSYDGVDSGDIPMVLTSMAKRQDYWEGRLLAYRGTCLVQAQSMIFASFLFHCPSSPR
jgi:hypothetical protein